MKHVTPALLAITIKCGGQTHGQTDRETDDREIILSCQTAYASNKSCLISDVKKIYTSWKFVSEDEI